MSFNKKFFTTGGIVASTPSAPAGLDPLQNFETVTYTGSGSIRKITGYIRKGAAFNGSSSKINTNLIAEGTGGFAASFWIKTTSTADAVLITDNTNGGSPQYSFYLAINSGQFQVGTKTGVYSIGSTSTVTDGNWHNVVITYDTDGVRVYVDSSTVYFYSESSPKRDGNHPIWIGVNGTFNNQYFNGSIDQVRIFNTALNSTQVGQLAAEDYTDPKKSTTDYFGDGSGVALYELDEDANSSNFGQAAVFNGSSSYVAIDDNSALRLTGSYTVSGWVNPSSLGADTRILAKNDAAAPAGGYDLVINSVNLYWQHVGSPSSSVGAAHSFSTGNWYHFTITYDSSNTTNNLKLYIDGVNVATSNASVPVNSETAKLFLGAYGGSTPTAGYFNGKIDQVRIYSSALSSGDVAKLYNESADVPTTNLVAHYKLDGNAEDVLDTYDGTASNVTYSAGVYGGTPTNVNFLGMAFQPDLVWMKNRDEAFNHRLADSVRGATKYLIPNSTNEESINSQTLTSFDSNGFTVGSDAGVNYNNSQQVAWCFKGGGTAVSGTSSQATNVTMSPNPDAGFSIVKFTSSTSTVQPPPMNYISHGLTSAPEMVIYKNIQNSQNWLVQHKDLNQSTALSLNLSNGVGSPATYTFFDNDATNIGVRSNYVISRGENYIAYCFHSVDGYQKVGSYEGTGGNQTISVGFQPRFVMIKRATGGSLNGWVMSDYQRGAGINLFANTSGIEADESAYGPTSFTSDGFTLAQAGGNTNVSGSIYIYLAIA